MPKRLSTEEVKATFERYGYTVPANFVYKNNITLYRVYDQLNNDYIDITDGLEFDLKNVSLLSADQQQLVLDNVSLHIPKKSFAAIN